MKKESFLNKGNILRIFLTIVLIAGFCCVYFFQFQIICLFDKTGYSAIAQQDFEVCFFDVGQGDSTFIRYKDISILIDAGPSSSELVTNLSNVNRGKEIDYFFVTHPDSDHTGGGAAIFKNFDVRNFYRPIILSTTENELYGDSKGYGVDSTIVYDNTIMAAYKEDNCKIFDTFSERVIYETEFTLDVFYPENEDDVDPSSSNSYSTVIKVTYQNYSYLFMADANFSIENKLISRYGTELDADVLKVAHHGSKYATSETFLEAVSPKYAVISVGTKGIKQYGHASEEFLTRVRNSGAEIYMTYECGNILFGNKDDFLIYTFSEVPNIHFGIISVVFAMMILIIWGIRVPKREKKKNKITNSVKK